MDIKKKYIKYKEKYLSLKRTMYGGDDTDIYKLLFDKYDEYLSDPNPNKSFDTSNILNNSGVKITTKDFLNVLYKKHPDKFINIDSFENNTNITYGSIHELTNEEIESLNDIEKHLYNFINRKNKARQQINIINACGDGYGSYTYANVNSKSKSTNVNIMYNGCTDKCKCFMNKKPINEYINEHIKFNIFICLPEGNHSTILENMCEIVKNNYDVVLVHLVNLVNSQNEPNRSNLYKLYKILYKCADYLTTDDWRFELPRFCLKEECGSFVKNIYTQPTKII
jgi:hypothetical protein